MIQSELLDRLLVQSNQEEWPYPKLFQALKDEGVTSYEVTIADPDATYYGSFGIWKKSSPEGLGKLIVSTTFNKQALVDALQRRMKKETTYVEFLTQLAVAGVARYSVSMADRTVIYYGLNADDFHIQHVPQIP